MGSAIHAKHVPKISALNRRRLPRRSFRAWAGTPVADEVTSRPLADDQAERVATSTPGTIKTGCDACKLGALLRKRAGNGPPSPRAGTIQKGTGGNRENRDVSNSFV